MRGSARWVPGAAPFFLFGAVYYFLVPYLSFRLLGETAVVQVAERFIPATFFDAFYLIDCTIIVASWMGGYLLATRLAVAPGSAVDEAAEQRLPARVLIVALSAFLVLQVAMAIASGATFFTGYETYDISVLGPISTTLYTAVLFYVFFTARGARAGFGLLFLVSSVLMLGLGSRMFFVLGVVSLIVAHVADDPTILRKPYLYVGVAVLAGLAVSVGLVRAGAEVSWEGVTAIAIAEPVFTAVSAATYLENGGGRPLLGVPIDVLASFVNFIPSMLFPGKADVLVAMMENPYVYSPFGASALMGNLYSNFGFAYPLFLFGVGGYYGFLRQKARTSEFFRAVYFVVLPVMMFHFFRENFVTVIKVMLFNALILPWVGVQFALLVSRAIAAHGAETEG